VDVEVQVARGLGGLLVGDDAHPNPSWTENDGGRLEVPGFDDLANPLQLIHPDLQARTLEPGLEGFKHTPRF
jgi:hypothetical protein